MLDYSRPGILQTYLRSGRQFQLASFPAESDEFIGAANGFLFELNHGALNDWPTAASFDIQFRIPASRVSISAFSCAVTGSKGARARPP